VALLAILQPDSLSLARLASALGDQHQLVLSDSWESLQEALRDKPVDGCVLELYHKSLRLGLSDVETLREHHRSLAIVVYADFTGREMDLFALGKLQVDGVVPAGKQESLRQIRETVAQALTVSMASRVLASLGEKLAPVARDCLRWAIENAHDTPSVSEMASAFFRSPRSLARSLRTDHAPTAGRLLLWGRLFRAIQMLGERGTSVERVAFLLGYSSGAALSRAVRREIGYSPREVLRRGGWTCVLEGFLAVETKAKAPRRAPRWSSSPGRRFPPPSR
jgi:AraC-like DNA-binding protein